MEPEGRVPRLYLIVAYSLEQSIQPFSVSVSHMQSWDITP